MLELFFDEFIHPPTSVVRVGFAYIVNEHLDIWFCYLYSYDGTKQNPSNKLSYHRYISIGR